jgi:tetratricopeptide (TPR) repeat protein
VLGVMSAEAQWKLQPLLHGLVMNGIECILNQEYEKADSLFTLVTQRYPEHPVGYLYLAAVKQSYEMDFDVLVEPATFDSLLTKGKLAAEQLAMPWKEYFLATADGYDAYERVERGDWLGGVRKGMSSATEYEKIIENDSSFYDAYVGLGTYYYWRSRKMEFLHWLPFVKDDRARGINMLIVGAEHSEYNRYAAMSALISIYLDDEKYDLAEKWSERGLQAYPHNRIFLWGLATAFDRQHRCIEAVSAYTTLLDHIIRSDAPHHYNEIVCRLNLAKCQLALSDTVNALHHLKQILSYEKESFPSHLQSRAKAKFEEAQASLKKIEDQRTALK